MIHTLLHTLEHTITDSIKLLPFLFIAYLIMEYIEHKISDKSKEKIKKSGKFGPAIGSLLGIFPQCGFSVAATNFYAARIITLGTLIAVYLSTSDEMLPILISRAVPINIIITILAIKFAIGMIYGFIIDFIINIKNKNKQSENKEETTSGNSIEPTSGEESTVAEDESTEATNEENNDEVAAEAGSTTTFTISEGEDSTTIANRLAEEGIIQDSAELQEIIANWGLDKLIQAGEYELSPDMSVHQVAEILTNGAYYYIP